MHLNRRELLLGTASAVGAWSLAGAPVRAQDITPSADVTASVEAARKAVADVEDAILRINREVWNTPELSLHEELSAQIHVRELKAAGFTVTEGTSGIPTAFLAEWSQGEGGPTIGFLPEYDALPGLGNAAEPVQAPHPEHGVEVGHGCGHAMLGAGCTGAAFALKAIMIERSIPGTIKVFGCAAEETEGAKVYMARDGLFDDLDAALAWHPAPMTGVGLVRTAAVNMIRIRFSGRTAHAGVDPWEGRSALKGAELFGIGIQFMREHLQPTTRLHYVYTAAGETPNVVPDNAEVFIMIRDADRQMVVDVTGWVREVAEGAAASTQTGVDFDLFFGLHDLLPNEPLVNRLHQHLGVVQPQWTEEEQDFARACQREMGLPEAGLFDGLLPIVPETTTGGATDVGDVSFNTPVGIFVYTTMPLGVGLHTWPVTACGGVSIADKASLDTAVVMAGVGLDLMTDADFRAEVRADFDSRLAGRRYISPLPPGKILPDGIPARLLLRDGHGEIIDGPYEGEPTT